MSQPTAYSKTTNFAQDEANNVGGRAAVRTSNLDAEFENIEQTLRETLRNLSLIQRDDGKLRDRLVEVYNLSSAAIAALQARIVVRGLWATSIAYLPYDLVDVAGQAYVCVTAHTSGTFATDYAAGKWQAFNSNSLDNILFRQDDANGVDRDALDKMRDYASFEDFGAVGDGVADDTTALTNAFASGKKIVSRYGRAYKITSTLTITDRQVDFSGATLVYKGAKNAFAMVINTSATWSSCDVRNFYLKSTDTDTTNRTHGLCFGGTPKVKNFRIEGFTGISLALGSGMESYTGVTLPGISQCFYCEIERAVIASTHGWNIVINTSNNANRFSNISTFPFNGFGGAPTRPANCIDEMVINGLDNTFERVSLEASPSNRKVLFLAAANGNEFIGKLYLEYNTNWAMPPFPRIEAQAQSSANRLRARHPYGTAEPVTDLGTGNDLRCDPTFYANGTQFNAQNSGANLVKNGRFENGLTGWTDLSTGTTVSYGTGCLSGKSLRLDVTAGRPQVSQDLVTVGALQVAALIGKNITIAAYVKTNLSDFLFRLNGLTNGVVIADGNYHWVTSTIKVPSGTTSVPVQLITSSTSVTGYAEVSDITAVIGNEPLAIGTRDPLEGSATYNPPSLADGAGATTTVTVAGAAMGDYVTGVSFGADLQGITVTGWVSAVDTVSVRFQNETGGVLDLASSTLRVRVQKA